MIGIVALVLSVGLSSAAGGQFKDQDRQKQNRQTARGPNLPATAIVKPTITTDKQEPRTAQCIDTDNKVLDCDIAVAQATIQQASDAHRQTGIAFGGFLVGALTLVAAAFAAKWAKSAAVHTAAGAREAKRSADAAVESAHVSRSTNLPILVLTDIRSDHNRTAGDSGLAPDTPVQIGLTFKNYGETIAILQRFWFKTIVDGYSRTGPEFNEKAGAYTFSTDQIISPGGSYPVEESMTYVSGIEDVSSVLDRQKQLLFAGQVEFSDFLGQTHRLGFLFGWSRMGRDGNGEAAFTLRHDPTGKYVFRTILPQKGTEQG